MYTKKNLKCIQSLSCGLRSYTPLIEVAFLKKYYKFFINCVALSSVYSLLKSKHLLMEGLQKKA